MIRCIAYVTCDIYRSNPESFRTDLQKQVYQMLEELEIAYERVDTDEVITMEDCQAINKKLDMKMVKTLFLTNRQHTKFYLFITEGDKAFKTKAFIQALGIARVSFADEDDFHKLLQTEIGAATIYSACSDGTTRGYMKVKT